MSLINLNLGLRQERMTDVQHLSPVVIISCIELIVLKHLEALGLLQSE